jgi:hypothetical protein
MGRRAGLSIAIVYFPVHDRLNVGRTYGILSSLPKHAGSMTETHRFLSTCLRSGFQEGTF